MPEQSGGAGSRWQMSCRSGRDIYITSGHLNVTLRSRPVRTLMHVFSEDVVSLSCALMRSALLRKKRARRHRRMRQPAPVRLRRSSRLIPAYVERRNLVSRTCPDWLRESRRGQPTLVPPSGELTPLSGIRPDWLQESRRGRTILVPPSGELTPVSVPAGFKSREVI